MSCSWHRRLWIYQEGTLAWDLLVPTLETVFDLEKIYDLYPEFYKSNRDASDGTARGFVEASMTRSIVNASRRLIRSAMFEHDVGKEPELALTSMLRALAHRGTSIAGDEAICIAMFMDVDTQPLLAELPENRMQKLLSLLPVLSKAILFAHGPRLSAPGFQWAPQTFLSPHGYRRNIQFPIVYKPDGSDSEQVSEIPHPYLCPKARGMIAFFSGIKIDHRPPSPLPEHFIVMTSEDQGFVIDVNDAGYHPRPWSEVCGDPSAKWAILLASEKKLRRTPDAILVEWLGETDDGKMIICKRRYDVIVESIDDCVLEGVRKQNLMQARFSGRKIPLQEWVID